INFATVNVIVADNGVGKTAICEWLWSLTDSSTLWCWGAYRTGKGRKYGDLKLAMDARAPDRHHVGLEITGGRTTFTVDNRKFPFSPIGYEACALCCERRFAGPSEAIRHLSANACAWTKSLCKRSPNISIRARESFSRERIGRRL